MKPEPLGSMASELADPAVGLDVEIVGDLRAASAQPTPLFDPRGSMTRG